MPSRQLYNGELHHSKLVHLTLQRAKTTWMDFDIQIKQTHWIKRRKSKHHSVTYRYWKRKLSRSRMKKTSVSIIRFISSNHQGCHYNKSIHHYLSETQEKNNFQKVVGFFYHIDLWHLLSGYITVYMETRSVLLISGSMQWILLILVKFRTIVKYGPGSLNFSRFRVHLEELEIHFVE